MNIKSFFKKLFGVYKENDVVIENKVEPVTKPLKQEIQEINVEEETKAIEIRLVEKVTAKDIKAKVKNTEVKEQPLVAKAKAKPIEKKVSEKKPATKPASRKKTDK